MTYRTFAAVALAAAIVSCTAVIAADTTPLRETVSPQFQRMFLYVFHANAQ